VTGYWNVLDDNAKWHSPCEKRGLVCSQARWETLPDLFPKCRPLCDGKKIRVGEEERRLVCTGCDGNYPREDPL
jgi:hypothetical protein